MALGRLALPALAGLLAALLVGELAVPPKREETTGEEAAGELPAALVLLLFAGVLAFAVLDARTGLVTDGVSIWAAKAKALLADGGLSSRVADPAFLGRYSRYPALVPVGGALVAMMTGFDAAAAKALEPFFYVSLLVSVFHAARRLVDPKAAVGAALVAGFLPAVSTDWNAGGFADLPLASFAAGAAAALLDREGTGGWRSAAPWHLAALTAIKREGAILALVGGFAALAGSPREMFAALRRHWRETTILALALGLQLAHAAWMAYPDDDFSGGWSAAIPRAGTVLRAAASAAFDPFLWTFFWPAAWAAIVALAIRGRAEERRLAGAVALAVLVDTGIFLFSSWDGRHPGQGGVAGHVAIAYPRLLEQVAGVASIVLAAGWRRLGPAGAAPPAGRG